MFYHISNFTSASNNWINVWQLATPNEKNFFRIDVENKPGVGADGILDDLNVAAGSFVVGKTYMIKTVGTTDFTTIGSPNNDPDQVFTASGVGSGTGTADNWDAGQHNVDFSLKGADNIGFIEAASSGLTVGVNYKIHTVGDTVWSDFGATTVSVGSFNQGTEYVITSLGTTTQAQWNTIADTSGETYAVGDIFMAEDSGTGLGTGTTIEREFECDSAGSSGTGVAIDMRPEAGDFNAFKSHTGSQTAPGWGTNLTFQANKIRFHDQYVFPTKDGQGGQTLVTDGDGQLKFDYPYEYINCIN